MVEVLTKVVFAEPQLRKKRYYGKIQIWFQRCIRRCFDIHVIYDSEECRSPSNVNQWLIVCLACQILGTLQF